MKKSYNEKYRVIKQGDLYQAQYSYRFFGKRWAPMLRHFEGPRANFSSLEEAIAFIKENDDFDDGQVVWKA